MYKILIVEDDEKLRNELKIFLERNGYEVDLITKFNNVVNDILNIKSDIILLDINLPFTDGEFVCKEIRKVSNIPIIIVTSRDNELDELISLNYGADQYVTKPYNIQILLAKINALLRRSKETDTNQNRIDCNEFILDISKSLIQRNEEKIELTKNEIKILHYLIMKRGSIVSREEIMNYLWDSQSFIDDNTLTVNIKRLRNKLEELNLKDMIETKRGQGYILK